ncbi:MULTISPECIES: CesT family type III secretion system chaperone [Parachlamydia]|jgi:hypothetical protein|uniref:Type III secretion specific chlamydia chaperone 1 n=2 Tax=Parachlamydia acanthamoebae TaxID=83552 RepID=F8KXZ2_PARAV|nr:CesT family type III secretion system chaperone [Parachlamydia acanthamoebae]EFB40386.1 hypothetical protein pah_c205o016 [Parachlamydia acanthamoebae str. Hall's coccus]CCB85727.1 type III secretion specific chlamydia chaperone 1 [Parachlamydia acanthamoebae UV-7]
MVSDLFDTLLAEVGQKLKINDLHADRNHSCLINFKEGISIQIERETRGERMIFGTTIGSIPPSKYRENVFREALRANGLQEPRIGAFAYSKQSDQLILYGTLPMQDLTSEKIVAFLIPFKEKAVQWKTAIERGDIPSLVGTQASPGSGGGMFGLRP